MARVLSSKGRLPFESHPADSTFAAFFDAPVNSLTTMFRAVTRMLPDASLAGQVMPESLEIGVVMHVGGIVMPGTKSRPPVVPLYRR